MMLLAPNRDVMNLLSKITMRRGINLLKILSSYYLSRLTGEAIQFGLPLSISVEPTTSCNLRCPECPSGLRSFTRETGMLEPDFFRRIIDELYHDIWYLQFYFQGEPYLNRHFHDMIRYASSKGIYTATSTNAHFLTDDMAMKTVACGLDRLIISIDGTRQETYEVYRRGGHLEKVLDGTRNIIRWKKKMQSEKPYLIFQFLVVAANESEIESAKKMAIDEGVNEIRFKTAQIYDYEDGHSLMPANEQYSRYKRQVNGKYQLKNKLLNHCWKLWSSCVITWDGIVVPCCFDKDAKHRMGDLKQMSFKRIWNSQEYEQFRKSVLHLRKSIDICSNCSEGTSVWENA